VARPLPSTQTLRWPSPSLSRALAFGRFHCAAGKPARGLAVHTAGSGRRAGFVARGIFAVPRKRFPSRRWHGQRVLSSALLPPLPARGVNVFFSASIFCVTVVVIPVGVRAISGSIRLGSASELNAVQYRLHHPLAVHHHDMEIIANQPPGSNMSAERSFVRGDRNPKAMVMLSRSSLANESGFLCICAKLPLCSYAPRARRLKSRKNPVQRRDRAGKSQRSQDRVWP